MCIDTLFIKIQSRHSYLFSILLMYNAYVGDTEKFISNRIMPIYFANTDFVVHLNIYLSSPQSIFYTRHTHTPNNRMYVYIHAYIRTQRFEI